jgi:NTE family protein
VLERPDILVLGGGGVAGEAWMTGLLAGLEDAAGWDLRHCGHYVGTSAGAIVAARLAHGERPRRPRTDPGLLPARPEIRFRRSMPALVAVAGAPVRTVTDALLGPVDAAARSLGGPAASFILSLTAPFAAAALGVMTPAGALARIAALRLLPEPTGSLEDLRRHLDSGARSFDGRLTVTAVDRATGRRVLFGAAGAPPATVAAAVHASCTIPWRFPAVRIGEGEYVDGGIWSPTNLDAAPATRSSRVLCLNPTAGLHGPHPLITLARAASRSTAAIEAAALRHRGAEVEIVSPSAEASELIGSALMATGSRRELLAAGYRQGIGLAQPAAEADPQRRGRPAVPIA